MNSALIIGCGDVGRRIAAQRHDQGVTGVVRTRASVARLKEHGIESIRADLDNPVDVEKLPMDNAQVYYLAPPPPEGETDPRLRNLCAAASDGPCPAKIVYISTSAVYGDCSGRWIDESAPLRPGTARGLRRLDAERRLLDLGEHSGVEVVILRVPGIYGPGKLPLERLKKRLPVLSEPESPYTNRIHVDDLADICIRAMQKGRTGQAYNVSDGHPSSMLDYFNRVAEVFGLPRPPVVNRAEAEKHLTAAMMSFLGESKRLINHKMLQELGVTLRYPDIQTALQQMRR